MIKRINSRFNKKTITSSVHEHKCMVVDKWSTLDLSKWKQCLTGRLNFTTLIYWGDSLLSQHHTCIQTQLMIIDHCSLLELSMHSELLVYRITYFKDQRLSLELPGILFKWVVPLCPCSRCLAIAQDLYPLTFWPFLRFLVETASSSYQLCWKIQ